MPLAGIVHETARDFHPPLYYFALHYWVPVAGDSEFGARLLSVMFGLGAILAVFGIAASMFDRHTGVVAAMLVALSRFQIEFSQEARMYMLLALLGALSMWFLWRLLTHGSRWPDVAGYVVVTALMMYTQVYALFLIAAQNLYAGLQYVMSMRDSPADRARFGRRWLLAQAALAVVFLPWISVLVSQVARVEKAFWIDRVGPRALIEALGSYSGSIALAIVLIALMAWGIVRGFTEGAPRRDARETTFLLFWLGGPLVLPWVVSQFSSPIFLPKYTLPASLPFAILAARGLAGVKPSLVRHAIAVTVLVLSLRAAHDFYSTVRKEAWREAVAEFQQLARAGDLVLFSQRFGQIPFDYYLKRADLIEQPFPDYGKDLNRSNVGSLLRDAIDGRSRVWLVLTHPDAMTPLIPQTMAEWYAPVAHRTPGGVELYLFERRRGGL